MDNLINLKSDKSIYVDHPGLNSSNITNYVKDNIIEAEKYNTVFTAKLGHNSSDNSSITNKMGRSYDTL